MTQLANSLNQKKPKARAIHKPGVMNKTEEAYAAHLHQRKLAGEIADYKFESYTLKLADNCRYTPDFMVLMPDGTMQFHEVKGFWFDDAKVKIKVAARQFPHIFLAVRKVKKEWEIKDFTDYQI